MRGQNPPLMMELPEYRLPNLRNLALGLWERARIFLSRVGGIILTLMVVLWFLGELPRAPARRHRARRSSTASPGMLGRGLQHIFAPIGFNWQISIALVPGHGRARESPSARWARCTRCRLRAMTSRGALTPVIASSWSLATALSSLAWYVFAPQCLSTLAVVKRETNSWRYPLIMAGYLFALAYLAAFITYHAAVALGGG